MVGVSKEDIDKITVFAEKHGLKVIEKSSSKRSVKLKGSCC